MQADIQRVNTYRDSRFSQRVLWQHGAFLADGQPYEVEITGSQTAVVRGLEPSVFPEVIELFRFFAEHICCFYDEAGRLVREYPTVKLFWVDLSEIQPSQFYVDEEKLAAVKTFVTQPEDIVVPVIRGETGYISLDGHTRLAQALELGFDKVMAFQTQAGEYIKDFVREAQNRGIFSPYELKLLSHEEYEVQWNQFCEAFFERRDEI